MGIFIILFLYFYYTILSINVKLGLNIFYLLKQIFKKNLYQDRCFDNN